ncbi:MAG TPA: hypothetical protein VMY16_02675 [Ilumatobacteraceae bacterium]|nr:hypothetical protein [Ilumatobacteraceae bacterium]
MTTARSSRPDEPRPPLARLVELALVVPIEVSGRLIETVPGVVDKVPAAAERVKREVELARFLGKMVVDQGVRELRTRLSPNERAGIGSTPTAPTDGRSDAPDRAEVEVEQSTPAAGRVDAERPDVTTLALADYDHLSSAQIVGKLDGLDAAERTAIERYEEVGRHRRTILGKLEQLRRADA